MDRKIACTQAELRDRQSQLPVQWAVVALPSRACHYPKFSLGHGKISQFYQWEMRSKTVQVGVHPELQKWAEKQFAGAKLTDVRRVARIKKIAEAMAVHPGRSIPRLCGSPYAV